MHTFIVDCRIDNNRTEVTVRARDSFDAQKLVKAQYPGSKVTIISTKKID